jgi:predicted MPP superfamily phosphohydrolase
MFGRKYVRGLFRRGDTWMYVNRGLGVVAPPVRLNCPPEITLIHLHCA